MIRSSGMTTCARIALTLLTIASCTSQDGLSPETDSAEPVETTPDLARKRRVKVTRIELKPAGVSLAPGSTQQFSATAHRSDGTTAVATVTYQATGGSIGSAGLYSAGQTAGTFRVIAVLSGSTLADTATITITAPAPAPGPSTGRTFFTADAEDGTLRAWTLPWGVVQYHGTVTPSSTRVRAGSFSYKYEVTSHANAMIGHDVRTNTASPQVSMGSPNGRYLSGYYSFWAYVDAGYTAPGWNLLLGWMTGVNGAPSPISNIGLQVWNGTLQIVYTLKNCSGGAYPCPAIPDYTLDSGWYLMTPQSPAGVKPFPRRQWVHLVVYYKMAPTNGQVTIWQDGTKIMDLTAPTMNTFGGWSYTPLTNTAGDMMLQLGIYGGPKSDGVQRLYIDDFKVTDYRPLP